MSPFCEQTLSRQKKCEKEENKPPNNKRWFMATQNKNKDERRTRCFVVINNVNREGLHMEKRPTMAY